MLKNLFNLHTICYSHICNTLVLPNIALNPSKVTQVGGNNLGTIWIVKIPVYVVGFNLNKENVLLTNATLQS